MKVLTLDWYFPPVAAGCGVLGDVLIEVKRVVEERDASNR